jgi:outer membrane protein insertion porin family
MRLSKSFILLIFCFILSAKSTFAQEYIDYATPRKYEIGGITVNGLREYDEKAVLLFSGLSVGDIIHIPGEVISGAIKKLWDQGLFSDVSVDVVRTANNMAFINIEVQERPRLSRIRIKGVKKSEVSSIKEDINISRGKTLTQNAKARAERVARGYFIEKGYYNVKVTMTETIDTLLNNSVFLDLDIDKGNKMKINDIVFHGNNEIPTRKLQRAMKGTKKKSLRNIFSSSKFIHTKFQQDKQKVIAKYNENGFRDAKISRDTIYQHDDNTFNIEIYIDEGNKYYFRNIKWVGNSKYSSKYLSDRLGINKGDVFNQSLLDERLHMSENSSDISSLYMDDGYLFFQINPIEVMVENDSIDFEMHIYEGKQARINKVTLKGNTKTNDHVVIREIRTYPGDLFSRSDIIRTQRELAQLGFFNPESPGS